LFVLGSTSKFQILKWFCKLGLNFWGSTSFFKWNTLKPAFISPFSGICAIGINRSHQYGLDTECGVNGTVTRHRFPQTASPNDQLLKPPDEDY
jgi:hypothetical protein